ncbi:hypothetical protein EJ04DRAFT_556944 [Polyplosphaeria fusca]|uniref:Fe2OG dioxygenase domain-containing protein n=1 Tax=Polyplosphaeria fusca TaxID=682080 RepID=A0A9P4UWP8_9PLEO|nr:hypothetical protein EJ04DRAFT_556944 [Polyplosphaeria fusca]
MAANLAPSDVEPLHNFRIPDLPPDFYYIPNFITTEEEASILRKIPAQRWVTLSHRRLQAHPSTLTPNNTLLASPLQPFLITPVVDRFKTLDIFDKTPHRTPNHVLINEYKRGEGIMPHEDGSAYAEVVATVSLGASICLQISPKPGDTPSENNPCPESSMPDDSQDADDKHNYPGSGNEDTIERCATSTSSSRHQYKIPTRILQEPRSLLITTGPAYTNLLHGIAPNEVDEDLSPDTVANWSLLAEPQIIEAAGGRNERATRVSLTYRDVLKVSSAASKVFGGLGKR